MALRFGGLQPPPRGPSAPHFGSLSVGGLQFQPRQLGVFRSGMQSTLSSGLFPQVQRSPTFHPPMMGPLLQAGTSDLVSAVIPTGSTAMTMSTMHDHLKAQHLRQWLLSLDSASSASTLVCTTADSEFAESHRIKAVSHFAPSTLAAYLRIWRQWEAFAVCHQSCPYEPHASMVADFLHVHSKSSLQGLATAHIRALTRVSKHAGFPQLLAVLQEPLTRAYAVATNPQPRREAAPLPLSFVVWLETCILSSIGTPADRLIMGGILVLIWGSLRWSDSQWINPNDLLEDMDSLRGLARRTKVTSRGMPWGILRCGFLGHTVNSPWSTLWLNLVRESLHATASRHQGFKPDFLIPQIGTDVEAPLFLAPMSRAQGVLLLRKFLLWSNSEADVQFIGVHSCKVTFLSWSRQLGLDEEQRRHQGHHRAAGAGFCVDLYSRDDVHPALALQRTILARISSGFRPIIPMMRGGAPSIADRPVTIPAVPGLSELETQTAVALPEASDHLDTDSNASAESAEDSPELTEPAEVLLSSVAVADCVFLLNDQSMVAHCAQPCLETDPQVVCKYLWNGSMCSFKFACGARKAVGDSTISPAESVPASYRICLRAACARAFD